jgi:hypothetical protein
MVANPPELWSWMCTHWCPIPASLAWTWWRGVMQARYPPADAWRARFLAFDAPDRLLGSDLVEDFFAEIATPQHLMDLVEHLIKERCVVRRDGHQLQEYILAHVTKDGTWKHQQLRKGVV